MFAVLCRSQKLPNHHLGKMNLHIFQSLKKGKRSSLVTAAAWFLFLVLLVVRCEISTNIPSQDTVTERYLRDSALSMGVSAREQHIGGLARRRRAAAGDARSRWKRQESEILTVQFELFGTPS